MLIIPVTLMLFLMSPEKVPSLPQLPRDDRLVLDLNQMLLVSGTISQTVHGLCQCIDFSIV